MRQDRQGYLYVELLFSTLESHRFLPSTIDQGKTVDVQLTDRCEGCALGDLDFSPHAFNQIADPSAGRISGISWQIIN